MKLHTEKRIAPFVATQIFYLPIGNAKRRICVFAKAESTFPIGKSDIDLCGKLIVAQAAEEFNTFPKKEAHSLFLPRKKPKQKNWKHIFSFSREDVLPYIMFASGRNQYIFRPKNRVLSYLLSASSTETGNVGGSRLFQ